VPLKIVRNDITKMNTDAIVNTANIYADVGTGCDFAVYKAAGYDELLNYRREHVGNMEEGEAFITPGFNLQAKYIIHAVSPLYVDGNRKEEVKLRSCYRKSLCLAKENGIRSVAFPLISTGGFGYPKEDGLRIAVDEINAFLLKNEMEIFLVVFDSKATRLGERIYPDLEEYIDRNYVKEARKEEYGSYYSSIDGSDGRVSEARRREISYLGDKFTFFGSRILKGRERLSGKPEPDGLSGERVSDELSEKSVSDGLSEKSVSDGLSEKSIPSGLSEKNVSETTELCRPGEFQDFEFDEKHENRLEERMKHLTDTYSEYLMYLIKEKNKKNSDVWRSAIVDKKVFSKIKNNADYHPNKLTALCLCIGAELNLDETKDLLARAGYALSPCDKTDIIFSYFIENGIYDMIELDIQLEAHGLPCIIS